VVVGLRQIQRGAACPSITSRRAAALCADPTAKAFFAELSNSLQRYHVDNINAAKDRRNVR
jgi:hypothetical protein